VVGWFISAAIVGGAVAQWPLGRYSDRHDRRKVIFGASAVATVVALALFVLALFGRPPLVALIAGAACLGGAALPIYSLAISHANDRADPGEFVRIASGLILFFGIGAVLGPAVSAAVVRAAGSASLFACLAVVCALLCVFAFVRTRYSEAPASKEDFVMMSRSSPAAFELDPRAAPPAAPRDNGPGPAAGTSQEPLAQG
jgi:MFS family permease